MAELYDVVVIGGGISGLTTAYHLRKRDKNLRVLVLEAKGLITRNLSTVSSFSWHWGCSVHLKSPGTRDWLGVSDKQTKLPCTLVYCETTRASLLSLGSFWYISSTALGNARHASSAHSNRVPVTRITGLFTSGNRKRSQGRKKPKNF